MKRKRETFKELSRTEERPVEYLLDQVYETETGFCVLTLEAGDDEMDVAPSAEQPDFYIIDTFTEGYPDDQELSYADALKAIDRFLEEHNDDAVFTFSEETDVAL